MNTQPTPPKNKFADQTPFHKGEKMLHSHIGLSDEIEAMGRKVIRSFMPDQHRVFFSQLPYIVIGSVDEQGWPWASVLAGDSGFISSPSPTSLTINAQAQTGNPIAQGITPKAPIGLLGIELATRRRNRMNSRVSETTPTGFTLAVDQSMGNCPKYIQTRDIRLIRDTSLQQRQSARHFTTLDTEARSLIRQADTFFVASYTQQQDTPEVEGVDVSHRGGKPGFVRVEGDTLTIPDYAGNNVFMTLGNFLMTPKAGLVFIDFDSGDLLMLTGQVEILWENAPEVQAFTGAHRAWRFTLDHGVKLTGTLPFTFQFNEASPSNATTGDWDSAQAKLDSTTPRNTGTKTTTSTADGWQRLRVIRTEDETPLVRSFYLSPDSDAESDLFYDAANSIHRQPEAGSQFKASSQFKAGQHLPVRIQRPEQSKPDIRTYTLSSAPGDKEYRLSVKREQQGRVSEYLHKYLKAGDVIEARAPQGRFYLREDSIRPTVLLAAGIGITPMISMARHLLQQHHQAGKPVSLTILQAARTEKELAFADQFYHMMQDYPASVKYRAFISQPDESWRTGHDEPDSANQPFRLPEHARQQGRIDSKSLQAILPLGEYDFYLCGPGSFMQAQYENLISLGVKDSLIQAEAFGPSSLVRNHRDKTENIDSVSEPVGPTSASVTFTDSEQSGVWKKEDGNLLSFAENQGLEPDFSCRNGSCGSCITQLEAGSVIYPIQPEIAHADHEIVLCCAQPGSNNIRLKL